MAKVSNPQYTYQKPAEVIVRIPQPDGSIIELRGLAQNITLSQERDIAPMYDIGNAYPKKFTAGARRTRFTIEGVATNETFKEPPKEKVIKPSRWTDIMEDIDE